MKSIRLRLYFAAALVTALSMAGSVATMEQAAAPAQAPAAAQAPATSPGAKKTIGIDEITAWKNIGTTALSNNGEWFAYRVAPQEGDAELDREKRRDRQGNEVPARRGRRARRSAAPAGPGVRSAAPRWRSRTTRSGSLSTPAPRAPKRSGCAGSGARSRAA